MEIYLSKIFNFFINPLYILFLITLTLIFAILFTEAKKLVIFLSKLFLFLFLFFGYTPLSNFLLNKIEDYIQPSKYPVQQLTGVIIMGGAFNSGLLSKERNEASMNSGAERLTKALEIYKKNPKILILFSGFSSELYPEGWSESQIAKKFFFDQALKNDNLIY
jgi:uncharacterized SAM-binding protein YcdF (DUF218 family)